MNYINDTLYLTPYTYLVKCITNRVLVMKYLETIKPLPLHYTTHVYWDYFNKFIEIVD